MDRKFKKRARGLQEYAERLGRDVSLASRRGAEQAIVRAVEAKHITADEAFWVWRRAFGAYDLTPARIEFAEGAELTQVGESVNLGVERWRERANRHADLIDAALR